jgi:hypothetical protein
MLYIEVTATGMPTFINITGISTLSAGGTYSTNAPTLAPWWSATILHTETTYQQLISTNNAAPGTP